MNSRHPDPGMRGRGVGTALADTTLADSGGLAGSASEFHKAHFSCYLLYLRAFTPSKGHTSFHGISIPPIPQPQVSWLNCNPLVHIFQEFHPSSVCCRTAKGIPKDGQRAPKGTPKKLKGIQSQLDYINIPINLNNKLPSTCSTRPSTDRHVVLLKKVGMSSCLTRRRVF